MPSPSQDVATHVEVEFDPYDPSLYHPIDRFQERVKELAAAGPLVWSTCIGGFWVATGYAEIQEVLRNSDLFSAYPNMLVQHGYEKLLPSEIDPPDHTSFRLVLQPLFSPARMKALEVEVRGIVSDLLDGFAQRGNAEFISEFAHELPAKVFLALLDLPLSDAQLFSECTDTTLLGKPGASLEESNAARAEAAKRMSDYFLAIIRDRRSRPVDPGDVTSAVVNSTIELDGERRKMTEIELCSLLHLLVLAGLHTTQGSLAWSLQYLAGNPEQRRRIIEAPARIPAAIEEILRMEAAVSPARRAQRDTTLGGVPLKKDDLVLVVLSGANRDEREFAGPTEFDIDRSPNRHLTFGGGPHRCIGSHLARIELRIALEEIHRRIPDYWMHPDLPARAHGSQTRGVQEMHILFTPETAKSGAL